MWGWELLKGELKNIAFLKGKETKLNKVTIILDGVKQMIKQWSKYISGNKELAIAIQILKEIKKANYYSLIVGGTVRDIVLGTSIYDIDLTTNMPTIELEKIFKTHDIGKSKDFGILVIEKEGYNFEISTFRQDGKYLDGRRPETVSPVSSFKEDVLRRDFTINALGLTDNGEIIDHVDGINDIKNKVIRTVGNPYERFEEDYVRMIRAARFGSIEGFKIIDETQRAIKKMASLINNTTPERIRLELIKAADKPGKMFAKFIVLLEDLGLLKHILPEVSDLKNYPHTLDFHPEGPLVWDHVIKCVEISNKNYLSQLAILFHDIGKSKTLKFKENGRPKYYFHASVGAEMRGRNGRQYLRPLKI
jgi:tRNA nucleotidyltransferase/poly(A) polymerase